MNKKIIVLIVAFIVILAVIILWQKSTSTDGPAEVVAPTVDAIDVVVDFMDDWLEAREDSETGSINVALAESDALTKSYQEKLKATLADLPADALDPVLCQNELPGNVRSKVISETDTMVQVYVIATGQTLSGQSLVNLVIEDGAWKINSIQCTTGETAPPMGEYSFENSGQLLKTVPPPLDSNFWYLVYESEEVFGYTAKLFFDTESMCTDRDGAESVCDPETFRETSKVFLQGDISEAGVAVKRVKFE